LQDLTAKTKLDDCTSQTYAELEDYLSMAKSLNLPTNVIEEPQRILDVRQERVEMV